MFYLQDYRCKGCLHEFELLVPRTKKDHIQKCPECGHVAKKIPFYNPKHCHHVSWTTWRMHHNGD